MPAILKNIRPDRFGKNCIFAITDWKGFLGNLEGNQATVTGTINEVETPWGTGVEVGASNSYIDFDLSPALPTLTKERSVFIHFKLASVVPDFQFLTSWGFTVLDNLVQVFIPNVPSFAAGHYGDWDSAGTPIINTWYTSAMTNTGLNGGANLLYLNGNTAPIASGTNGGNLVTTTSDMRVFASIVGTLFPCVLGTELQTLLVFDKVLSAASVESIHNNIIGLGTNP